MKWMVMVVLLAGIGSTAQVAVKTALTEPQIRALRAGEGMGLALPAELNGHPGPKHVLELSAELKLTQVQRDRAQALFDDMNADARRLGDAIIQAEAELFQAFAAAAPSGDAIERLTSKIGMLQASLRARHLRAHLEMGPVLTKDQLAAYARLRSHEHHD